MTSLRPSTSQQITNLPDVLRNFSQAPSQNTKTLTNVQKIAQDLQSRPTFHLTLTPGTSRRHKHIVAPPIYTAPNKKIFNQSTVEATATLATPELDECELDMRGAMALSPDSGSDHSGGSNETVKIDDIEYADA